jgi:hypothetical protein
MGMSGKKIVLVASRTESNERDQDCWVQMLFATLPSNIAHHFTDLTCLENEVRPDGQAQYVPNGLRVVESILLQQFSPEEVAVCYPDQLEMFVGEETRAVGVHAHNPLGITFATDVYAQLVGPENEPLNATEFKKLILHPALRRHKHHLNILIGRPGAWQIEQTGMQKDWGIDCVVDGEAEALILISFPGGGRWREPAEDCEGREPQHGGNPRHPPPLDTGSRRDYAWLWSRLSILQCCRAEGSKHPAGEYSPERPLKRSRWRGHHYAHHRGSVPVRAGATIRNKRGGAGAVVSGCRG